MNELNGLIKYYSFNIYNYNSYFNNSFVNPFLEAKNYFEEDNFISLGN